MTPRSLYAPIYGPSEATGLDVAAGGALALGMLLTPPTLIWAFYTTRVADPREKRDALLTLGLNIVAAAAALLRSAGLM